MPEKTKDHLDVAAEWRRWAQDRWTESGLPINVEFAMWLAQYHATMAVYELLSERLPADA